MFGLTNCYHSPDTVVQGRMPEPREAKDGEIQGQQDVPPPTPLTPPGCIIWPRLWLAICYVESTTLASFAQSGTSEMERNGIPETDVIVTSRSAAFRLHGHPGPGTGPRMYCTSVSRISCARGGSVHAATYLDHKPFPLGAVILHRSGMARPVYVSKATVLFSRHLATQ